MGEEIKEILDKILLNCDTQEEKNKLLDYITNLQEKIERLKKENTKLYKKDIKIINELKEELEITEEKWNKDKQFSKCRTMEMLGYKSRCEKANWWLKEMLKQAKSDETKAVINGTLELLLNGGENNVKD